MQSTFITLTPLAGNGLVKWVVQTVSLLARHVIQILQEHKAGWTGNVVSSLPSVASAEHL